MSNVLLLSSPSQYITLDTWYVVEYHFQTISPWLSPAVPSPSCSFLRGLSTRGTRRRGADNSHSERVFYAAVLKELDVARYGLQGHRDIVFRDHALHLYRWAIVLVMVVVLVLVLILVFSHSGERAPHSVLPVANRRIYRCSLFFVGGKTWNFSLSSPPKSAI